MDSISFFFFCFKINKYHNFISIKQRVPIRSEISWNPDFSLVAIGNDDG